MPQTLQLSENGGYFLSENGYTLSEPAKPAGINLKNFIWIPDNSIPGGGTWENVNRFSNMTEADFNKLLDLVLPFQPGLSDDGMSFLGLGKKAQAYKQQKQDARIAKKAAKTAVITSRADLKSSKAEGIRSGTFQPGGAIQKGLEGVTGVVSKLFGGDGGVSGNVAFDTSGGQLPPPEEKTFLQKYGLALGIGVVVLVGGVYMLTRNK